MADAGDLKSLALTGIPVRVREGLPTGSQCARCAASDLAQELRFTPERFALGLPSTLALG